MIVSVKFGFLRAPVKHHFSLFIEFLLFTFFSISLSALFSIFLFYLADFLFLLFIVLMIETYRFLLIYWNLNFPIFILSLEHWTSSQLTRFIPVPSVISKLYKPCLHCKHTFLPYVNLYAVRFLGHQFYQLELHPVESVKVILAFF